jgi:hypothetical protein
VKKCRMDYRSSVATLAKLGYLSSFAWRDLKMTLDSQSPWLELSYSMPSSNSHAAVSWKLGMGESSWPMTHSNLGCDRC